MKSNTKEGGFQMFALGRHYKETRTEILPTGDKVINAVRAAIWEAWERGLEKNGKTIYPRVPLLDKEPMEPEM